MKLTVKYFGAIADVTQKKEEQIDFEEGNHSVHSIQKRLIERYPGIKNLTFSIALNRSIANNDTMVNENDELALLPPFAGG